MRLGMLCVREYLERTQGKVYGELVTDAKRRFYRAEYAWRPDPTAEGYILVRRADGRGEEVRIRSEIELDQSLVAFLGLYSGDGAKGTPDKKEPQRVRPAISFSQREHNLVRFAVTQFRRVFGGTIRFHYSYGEDSAFFMAGDGYDRLVEAYGGRIPAAKPLSLVRPKPSQADERYLTEKRPVAGAAHEHLAFYYQHKEEMERALTARKNDELREAGIELRSGDRASASLRRPFKKGARSPGGSSRSDELFVGGVTGIGELFLKMLHDVEASIYDDAKVSSQGLVRWDGPPSTVGRRIELSGFFSTNAFGQIGKKRPKVQQTGDLLVGRWPRSKEVMLRPHLKIDPLWCYVGGLYLAEGTTPKSTMFSMFGNKPKSLGLGFTSTEDVSITLVLRALEQILLPEDVLTAWKIKVGSQYFPELVVNGLKLGVPMLRGGKSGDGKLRTAEISLAIREWGLQVAPVLRRFESRYSHVEPTGAGLPRIDFWASSAVARWYFPLLMYGVFSETVANPVEEFTGEN